MRIKNPLFFAALTLTLVGNAQAGVKECVRIYLRRGTSRPQEHEDATPELVEAHGERGQRPNVCKWESIQNARKCHRVGACIREASLPHRPVCGG